MNDAADPEQTIIDWLNADDPTRDAASLVMPHLDYESQLIAILELLRHQRQAEEVVDREIDKLKKFAERTRDEHAIDEWIAHISQHTYHAAAHSMAAVGMIAPFIESLFYHAFRGIEHAMTKTHQLPFQHERWQRPAEDQWDCRYVWKNGRRNRDLVRGVMQLADAIGLSPHLPTQIEHTMSALFEYRNKMFHFGFEWPMEERRRFDRRLRESQWPADWFSKSTAAGDPWVFYMSSQFIDHCLTTAGGIITAIGRFCAPRLYSLEDGSLAINSEPFDPDPTPNWTEDPF